MEPKQTENGKLKTIKIDAAAHQAAKMAAVAAGITMSDWIAGLILRETEKGGKDSRNK